VCCCDTFANPPSIRTQASVISLKIQSEKKGKKLKTTPTHFLGLIFMSYQQKPDLSRETGPLKTEPFSRYKIVEKSIIAILIAWFHRGIRIKVGSIFNKLLNPDPHSKWRPYLGLQIKLQFEKKT